MKKVIFALILIFLLSSSARGFIVENRENKYAYDVETSIEFINTSMDDPHISASTYLTVWNGTRIHTEDGDVRGKFAEVYNFDNLTVAFGEDVEVYSGKNLKKIGDFHVNVDAIKSIDCRYPYLAFSSDKTYLINIKNGSINYFDIQSRKILISGGYFYMISKRSFYISNFSSLIYNASFDENINDFAVISGIAYLEFTHHILALKNGKIVDDYPTGGIGIYPLENYIFLEKFIIDDEGEKYWVFTLYNNDFSYILTHMLYVEPKDTYSWGNRLLIFDGKYTYILNKSFLIFRSSALESCFFNDTMVYLLPNDTVEMLSLHWKVVDSGSDNDGDWIMDKYDNDDDNDGIPDTWEEKYNMNPDDPSDANKDYDDDGLTNYQEYLNHTNPRNWDTDGDGLSDGFEVSMGLNPLSKDTDHDGFEDGWELKHGMNPKVYDRTFLSNRTYFSFILVVFIILLLLGKNEVR